MNKIIELLKNKKVIAAISIIVIIIIAIIVILTDRNIKSNVKQAVKEVTPPAQQTIDTTKTTIDQTVKQSIEELRTKNTVLSDLKKSTLSDNSWFIQFTDDKYFDLPIFQDVAKQNPSFNKNVDGTKNLIYNPDKDTLTFIGYNINSLYDFYNNGNVYWVYTRSIAGNSLFISEPFLKNEKSFSGPNGYYIDSLAPSSKEIATFFVTAYPKESNAKKTYKFNAYNAYNGNINFIEVLT